MMHHSVVLCFAIAVVTMTMTMLWPNYSMYGSWI